MFFLCFLYVILVRNAKAAGIFHGQKARDEEARK